MATLAELMAECLGEPATGQTKQASAAKTSTDEIDQVLENLGLGSSEAVKTASETENTNGGNMKLMDIYEQIMSEAPAQEQEKVAGEAPAEETTKEAGEEEVDPSTSFGETVGGYFNVMVGSYLDKVAGSLESEAGAGTQPMSGLPSTPAEKDPHMHVNRTMQNGKKLDVVTGGKSPYSLKEKALLKAILRRSAAGEVGNIKE